MLLFHRLACLGLLVTISMGTPLGWSAESSLKVAATYHDSSGDVTYVRIRPPSALPENPATLATTHAWIPGHWAQQNSVFFWRPGQVVEKPSPNAFWEPGIWVRVVTRHHGWRYRPGRWIID